MSWLPVQEQIPHTWVRPALRTLKAAGAEARVEDGTLLLADTPAARTALSVAAELRDCNDLMRDLAGQLGRPAAPYKPFEPYVLVAALLRAEPTDDPDGWTRVCHEVIWAQAFPNANHRSTVFWLQSRMAPPGSTIHHAETLEDEMDAYLHDSKALIHEREHRPDQARLKKQHRERTGRFIDTWMAHMGQSR